MTLTDKAQQQQQQKIDEYLDRLRRRLRGFDPSAVGEIVEELRSHILDRAAQSEDVSGEAKPAAIDTALAALGSPEELADQYVTDNLLARAEISRSPLRILRSLFRWGSLSVAGFFVLLGSLVGYFFGVVFMLVAVAKLFHPHTAGLWTFPSGNGDFELSFRLGFGSLPSGGREVLGWWIVPIGWLGGGALVMLTTYVAVWFVRQYRRSLVLPRP
ncbi:MAG: permease prefix domain 1-containing protein [Terriglobales bacterium]|jgi:uncharacterized membrane protein